MDCKKLIREIAKNPAVWDRKHKNFTRKIVVNKIWETIAINLNATKDDCKKKFKYLKDEYRKAQRKMQQDPAEQHVPHFKYFKMMGFLHSNSALTGESNYEYTFNDNSSCDDTAMTSTSLSEADANKPMSSNKLFNVDEYLEIERNRIKPLDTDPLRSEQEDSDDLLFFKSLLPYVKNISPLKKLEFRANLINTIINITKEGEFD